MIFAALVGAIIWNLLTWLAGLPSSSSHALFGGLIGATLVSVGAHGVHTDAVVTKVIIPAVAAPIVAGLAAMLATRLTYRLGRDADPEATSRGYRAGQIASAGLVSLAHGTNDAQKTMGVITLTLITGGVVAPGVQPAAVGHRLRRLGHRAGHLHRRLADHPHHRHAASPTSSRSRASPPRPAPRPTILASTHLGFALSTTQVCSGSVMGAGLGRSGAVVRWSTAGRMVAAWGLTLPAAGLVGGRRRLPRRPGPLGRRRASASCGLARVRGGPVRLAAQARHARERQRPG